MRLNITFLLAFCSLISLKANAQTPLPYSTGFDNSAEEADNHPGKLFISIVL